MLTTLAFEPLAARKLVFRHYPGRHEQKLLLVGTGDWADRGDAWLTAHDVFHHLPGDTGSVAEEMMTFGAELWLEHPSQGLDGINYGSLEGVLAESYHGSRSLEKYVLPEVPFAFRMPGRAVMERFRAVTELGVTGAAERFDARFGEGCRRSLPEEELRRFTCDENQTRCARWMALGYRVAQRRFPDPERGRELFGTLKVALERLPRPAAGVERVSFELDESRYALRGLEPGACEALGREDWFVA